MTAGYGGETGTRPSGRSANEVGSAVLAAAGCVFLLLGTFLPYVRYSGGEDYAVFDVDHLGTTWAGGLSYLIAVAAVPFVWILAFRRPRVLGAFLVGVGLVVTFDFIGAFVIAPTT